MGKYLLKRLGMMLVLLVGITFIVFGSLFLASGDPAQMIAGASATEADVLAVRAALGLDQPFWTQYGIYLKNLFSLNLGMSYITRQPILQEIAVRLPYTINLAVTAILLSTLVGIPLGIPLGTLQVFQGADRCGVRVQHRNGSRRRCTRPFQLPIAFREAPILTGTDHAQPVTGRRLSQIVTLVHCDEQIRRPGVVGQSDRCANTANLHAKV